MNIPFFSRKEASSEEHVFTATGDTENDCLRNLEEQATIPVGDLYISLNTPSAVKEDGVCRMDICSTQWPEQITGTVSGRSHIAKGHRRRAELHVAASWSR